MGTGLKVLVGEGTGPAWVQKLRPLGWGRMFTIRQPQPYPGEPWGWDNGAFIAWRSGAHASMWDVLARLKRDRALGTPYLAVVPDIVAGGQASLELSLASRAALPDDWPWYLAVQNGMKPMHIARYIRGFAGVFLGGDDAFKAQAKVWCDFAHDHGLPFHYGRAGTFSKLEHALEVGADSLDSAFPMWTHERFAAFAAHWEHRPQTTMAFANQESAK